MKREKLGLKLAVVGFAALTALAGSSFAQEMKTPHVGSFTLPFEAHWGTVDLKPGAYSFSVKNEDGFDVVRVKRNNQPIGRVVATTFDASKTPSRSNGELLCAHHNGAAVVAALDMPGNGVYHFYVPRGTKTIVSQATNPADAVPVLFAQK
jgi:hypothetical protein